MDVIAVVSIVVMNAAVVLVVNDAVVEVVFVAMNAVGVVVVARTVLARPLAMFLFCMLPCQRYISERMVTHHTRPIYDDSGRREDVVVWWCFGLLQTTRLRWRYNYVRSSACVVRDGSPFTWCLR